MKTSLHRALLIVGCLLCLPAIGSAQEEQLQAAMEMQDRRVEGLTKLADRISSIAFLQFARDLLQKLGSKNRKVDPFGMAMDPEEAVPDVVAAPEEATEEEAGPKTTLEEAVSKFVVTGLFPNRKEVIVGARNLKVGDVVVIRHSDVEFNLRIDSVTSDAVGLMDTETGEKAFVALDVTGDGLPAGMFREGGGSEGAASQGPGTGIVPMNQAALTIE